MSDRCRHNRLLVDLPLIALAIAVAWSQRDRLDPLIDSLKAAVAWLFLFIMVVGPLICFVSMAIMMIRGRRCPLCDGKRVARVQVAPFRPSEYRCQDCEVLFRIGADGDCSRIVPINPKAPPESRGTRRRLLNPDALDPTIGRSPEADFASLSRLLESHRAREARETRPRPRG